MKTISQHCDVSSYLEFWIIYQIIILDTVHFDCVGWKSNFNDPCKKCFEIAYLKEKEIYLDFF